jgi:cytochrome b6-f complex iron-sulfur subunit
MISVLEMPSGEGSGKVGTRGGAANDVSRRHLLDVLLSGGIVAFLGAVFYPVVRFLTPPKVEQVVTSSVVAATVGEVKPNSGKIFRFGSKPGILVRLPSGEWRAFSAVCTHLGCTVQYRSDLEQIWCPCHNGHFDLSGKNVSGPPPAPLEAYAVIVKGNDVVVSRRA